MIHIAEFGDYKNGNQRQEDEILRKKFISYPRVSWGSDSYAPFDRNLTEEVVMGRSPLSEYMDSYFFLAEENGKILGRIALFKYRENNEMFFGFFQIEKGGRAAELLIKACEKRAVCLGGLKITGPVEASFWTGYRFKTGGFSRKPYFGEPLNPPEYPQYFLNLGYEVSKTYHSYSYRTLSEGEIPKASEKRYLKFINEGFSFRNLNEMSTEDALNKIYLLTEDLYKDFPVFQKIKKEDFLKIFTPMKYIMDKDMIIIAERNGKPEGFLIAFPDYSDSLKRCGPLMTVIKAFFLRKKIKRYVFLYLGATQPGLGPALSFLPSLKLSKRQASSVTALIQSSKVTKNYMKDYKENNADDPWEYSVFSKDLSNLLPSDI